MANSVITAGSQVQLASGRIGVCVYDNPAITDNTHKSAYVIFNDQTYFQAKRTDLTVLPGGFFEGNGPGY